MTKFENLKPAEKRVAIARDVLAQLAAKRFVAKQGEWVDELRNRKGLGQDENAEVCKITKKQKTCNVCAMGALFVAAVERADRLKVSDVLKTLDDYERDNNYGLNQDALFNYVKRFFSLDQMEAIETAFERGEGATSHSDEAAEFNQDDTDPDTRMRLIMENIIVNKGRFRPEKKPVQRYVTPGFTG